MRVFRIIAKAAVAFYEELFFYFLTGLVNAVVWSIPIGLTVLLVQVPGLGFLYFSPWLLMVVLGPLGLTGIYIIGQKAVRGLGVKWAFIWDGIKEFGLRAVVLGLIFLLGYGLIAVNFWFYSSEGSPIPPNVAIWVTPIWVVLTLIWTAMAFYAQSFLMELQKPTILLALRNSLFLTILHPIQTFILLFTCVLALALSIVLIVPLIVLPGFVSVLSLTAVRNLVAGLQERVEAMEETAAEEEAGEATEAAEEESDVLNAEKHEEGNEVTTPWSRDSDS